MSKKAGDTARVIATKSHRMCKRFAQANSVEMTLEKVAMELFPAEVQAHCRDKEPTGLYKMADLITKFMAL